MSTPKMSIELVEPLQVRLQKFKADVKFWLLGKLSRLLVSTQENRDLGEVRTFCCFVGHGRSGGTLVGAQLNAHPNIVVANELNALRHLQHGLTATQLYRIIDVIASRQAHRGSPGGGGYSYAVDGQWQGKHEELHVVGDRKAGATAYEIVRNPGVLDTLAAKVPHRKLFIHVFRNPLDTIATTISHSVPKNSESMDAQLSREIRNYFARCDAVKLIEAKFGPQSLYHLPHERFVADPAVALRSLCKFLGVAVTDDYVSACAGIVTRTPHQTRNTVDWSSAHKSMIKAEMQRFQFLDEYAQDIR